ncbi:MAG: aspartate carbamoyltransferase catalytic subunit [Oligoflexia bacterium]|nr:aspartate carbamoyltransferase catalytic subunit [Oligoflexia bacterium]
MSIKNKSFTSIDNLSDEDIKIIFHRAEVFKKLQAEKKSFKQAFSFNTNQDLNALLVFIEPSTRTRISFEMACNNLGIHPILFSDVQASSIVKGESLEETLRTLKSLNPSLIVLRYKGSPFQFDDTVPVINGGFGSYEHPTQALVDAFTIQSTREKVKGQNILILGDVLHSRVSNSNLKLLKRLGAEVAFCSPSSLFPKDDLWKGVQCFQEINEGLKWADVVMCLRIQQERHDISIGLSLAEYRDQYHLGADQLKFLKKTAVILHPGPCIFGVEMSMDVLKDERNLISDQVTNGIFIRSAVLSLVLDFKWTFD